MHFENLSEAIWWLQSQVKVQPKTSLINMERALTYFHFNFKKTVKFHVAGTNGKGSVVKYLTQILCDAGYQVGSFMSPYVTIFNERILINGEPIDDETLFHLIKRIYLFNERYKHDYQEGLSFFELLTIMAFDHFDYLKLDAIVIEVGIGGLLDSTNIINYDASIITSIGMDHIKIIGPTIEDIARNKAGIIKYKNKAFTTVDDAFYPIFAERAKAMDATLKHIKLDLSQMDLQISEFKQSFTYQNTRYSLQLMGAHQVRNAVLAIEAIHACLKDVSDDVIGSALAKVTFQGRFEYNGTLEYPIILDAAHNSHGMKALKETIEAVYPNRKICVIMSALGDKDIKEMIEIIKPLSNKLILTGFEDFRYESLEPYQTIEIPYFEDPQAALLHAYDQEPDLIVVTGSIHFIGYFKNHMLKHSSKIETTFLV